MSTLATLLATSPYTAYAYAYPHKTAYRPIDPPVALSQLWEPEHREALFLYLHIPFCEMRCGFCNLFTQTNAGEDLVTAYLNALTREATQVKQSLGTSKFARMAIGGGTPTFLNTSELERLLDLATEMMGANPIDIPTSVEVSPQTATFAKLNLLKTRGIERISIGIQSFIAAETAAAGRPQNVDDVYAAIDRIKSLAFPTLNLDLIYGLPGQSIDSWLKSLQIALKFAPEELYLYPLYVRPLTGLGRSRRDWNDERHEYYRHACDLLQSAGYERVSMRMFRSPQTPTLAAPVYCCQSDGMLGLGCGARSYTSTLHYSSEYAVGTNGIQAIINNYIQKPADRFNWVDYGYRLTLDDRQRRFLIQSLLQADGLDLTAYRHTFGTEAMTDFPQLHDLLTLELAEIHAKSVATLESIEHQFTIRKPVLSRFYAEETSAERSAQSTISLTSSGIAVSDTIGAWLYSPQVKALMESYQWH
jgi:oxygen-independent coproporphyrinogen III oxidase